MGGMIAARYAQRYGDSLACVVLSGPVLGQWAALDALLPLDEMPDTPIDPSTLSRDPAVGEAYVADPLVWLGVLAIPAVAFLVWSEHQGNAALFHGAAQTGGARKAQAMGRCDTPRRP